MTNRFYISCLLLALGVAGGILFFPINLDNRYTCMYHQLRNRSSHPPGHMMAAHLRESKNQSVIPTMEHHMAMQMEEMKNAPYGYLLLWGEQDTRLLNRYLLPFGLLWWSSLAIFVIGCYHLRKWHRQHKKRAQ